jgi:hypothetical protein
VIAPSTAQRKDIRKIDVARAAVYIYNGYLPYRVEAFDSDSPFLYFFVKLFDYQAIEDECAGKIECTVELKGMIDAIRKTSEYVKLARASGVYQRDL